MRFLVDEDVPKSVADVLRARHDVLLVKETIGERSTDDAVAALAESQGLVLVTWNVRHFKALAVNMSKGGRVKCRTLNWVGFECDRAEGVLRATETIEHIELEAKLVEQVPKRRLYVLVCSKDLRINRQFLG